MKNEVEEITQETQGKHYEADVRNIKPLNRAGGNIRTDYGTTDGSFEELVKSIEANGIIVPIRAYRDKDNEGQWIAIDGHRRLTAAMKLVEEKGLTIRAKVITVDSRKVSDEQLIIDMVVTNSGKPLSPIEMAEAVRRLINYGYSAKDVATKFGKNVHFIRNLELLASAPKRMRDLVSQNKVSYSLVLNLLKDSPDFNEASNKIEEALSLSIKENRFKNKTEIIDSEEDFEVNEEVHAKISKRHLNEVRNVIDSFKELRSVLKKQIDNPKIVGNPELFSFIKKLANNELTIKDIENLIFINQ